MKCIHCKGRMERKSAPFQIDRKGYHLTLDEIPAWVCIQCGEVYFEKHEVGAIQEVIQSLDRRTKKLQEAA
ncbi:MAG: YgiT-type zinc finger protein [bacterium]